jgi:hypothetical protein
VKFTLWMSSRNNREGDEAVKLMNAALPALESPLCPKSDGGHALLR